MVDAADRLLASPDGNEPSVAMVFPSAELARRGKELLLQLAGTVVADELKVKVVRFDATGMQSLKNPRSNCRVARFAGERLVESPVSAEEQQWLRGWLRRHESEAGFAVLVPLAAGDVAQRLIEEAKLVAAVYRGTCHVFGAEERDGEGGDRETRRGQACCAW